MTDVSLYFEMLTNASAAASLWNETSRIEERTCRPVADGKRLPPNDKRINLVFFEESAGEPVGRIQCFDFNSRNRSAEFGYSVNPVFRGRGIGTCMLKLAISEVFSREDLNKLYCQTAEFNVPSVKLLERLGFHKDGVLREHHELDGKLWDDFVYSILRREWNESP